MKVTGFDIDRIFSGSESLKKQKDLVPVEAPLEVFLYSHTREDYERFAVFMRTPADDFELVAGFLFTEQIIESPSEVIKMFHCNKVSPERYGNTIKIILQPHVDTDTILQNKRHFIASSSCGICGSLLVKELVTEKHSGSEIKFSINKNVIFALANKSLKEQTSFKYTGGIHASSLFSPEGELLSIREDVGRHNALDKLIGSAVIGKNLSLFEKSLLFMSGRVSYELVQKAAVAGIPVICALGAPSTLSIELSKGHNIMLIAFIDKKKFNIYSTSERVELLSGVCGMV